MAVAVAVAMAAAMAVAVAVALWLLQWLSQCLYHVHSAAQTTDVHLFILLADPGLGHSKQ